jgi:hypothetical protein
VSSFLKFGMTHVSVHKILFNAVTRLTTTKPEAIVAVPLADTGDIVKAPIFVEQVDPVAAHTMEQPAPVS